MAKKKQLAGKKTKLAELPLTQALANHSQETAPPGPPEPLPSRAYSQPQLSQELAKKEEAALLAAAYFHLLRELTAFRSELCPPGGAAAVAPLLLPPQIPEPHLIRKALLEAQAGLQDLHRFLAPK
jgi:hypothetical protein